MSFSETNKPNNIKALNIVNTFKDVIYSYLEALPDKADSNKHYNNIVTVPVSQRNENNGYPNFKFHYKEFVTDKQFSLNSKYVRVETGVFNNTFSLKAAKVNSIKNVDLLIFADQTNPNILYISDKQTNSHKWLNDLSLRQTNTVYFANNAVTYYCYNIEKLCRLNHIVKIFADDFFKSQHKIRISYNDYQSESEINMSLMKDYHIYNLNTDHIKQVQYDGKTANSYCFGFRDFQKTSQVGTISMIVNGLVEYTDFTPSAIYQRIYKAVQNHLKDGKVHSCKVHLTKTDISIDSSLYDENNDVIIYTSTSSETIIADNIKTNRTADKATYQKVIMYLKRHNNNFNPKWNMNELEIADEYCKKHNLYKNIQSFNLSCEGEAELV